MTSEYLDQLNMFLNFTKEKLDPLQSILQNINIFVKQSNELISVAKIELISQISALQKKLGKIQDLANIFVHDQAQKLINSENENILGIYKKLIDELSINDLINQTLSIEFQDELSEFRNDVDLYKEEIIEFQKEINIVKQENQQLLEEIQLWHQTVNEEGKLTQDLSELIVCLSEKDKVIDQLKKENSKLHFEIQLNNQVKSSFDLIVKKIQICQQSYGQFQKLLEEKENDFHKQMTYKEYTIDSLKDQINLYKQRIKKFQKQVPILSQNDNPQSLQLANLYKVLIKLEEETFRIHQTYQSRVDNYTKDNLELRQKITSLEKTVNALCQSQNDNQQIITKMKLQGEKLQELEYQNKAMKEVLKDRQRLEKRIKELNQLELKEKEQKLKEEKEQKELKKKQELKQKEEAKKQKEEQKSKELQQAKKQ